MAEVSLELADSKIWDQPERAQKLGQERAALETVVLTIERLVQGLDDLTEILTLAVEEQDQDLFAEAASDLDGYLADLAKLEFQRMFSGAMDPNSAYLEIQSGSGGTEAQDWADMLLRMYLRWSESKGFKAEIIELSDGDVAGIKSATVRVAGAYAYGWLRTETGVHRLVRKSPFDSGSRRHTSFASIFISPELDVGSFRTKTALVLLKNLLISDWKIKYAVTPEPKMIKVKKIRLILLNIFFQFQRSFVE